MEPTQTQPEPLWTVEQTAAFLGMPNPKTLDAWRLRRQGPPWLKCGRLVRYSPAAVRAWLESHAVVPAGGAP